MRMLMMGQWRRSGAFISFINLPFASSFSSLLKLADTAQRHSSQGHLLCITESTGINAAVAVAHRPSALKTQAESDRCSANLFLPVALNVWQPTPGLARQKPWVSSTST